jgi:hypothetical protein
MDSGLLVEEYCASCEAGPAGSSGHEGLTERGSLEGNARTPAPVFGCAQCGQHWVRSGSDGEFRWRRLAPTLAAGIAFDIRAHVERLGDGRHAARVTSTSCAGDVRRVLQLKDTCATIDEARASANRMIEKVRDLLFEAGAQPATTRFDL